MIVGANWERRLMESERLQVVRSAVGLSSKVMRRFRICTMENRIGTPPWSRTSTMVSHGGMEMNHRVTCSLMKAVSLSGNENLVLEGEKVNLMHRLDQSVDCITGTQGVHPESRTT